MSQVSYKSVSEEYNSIKMTNEDKVIETDKNSNNLETQESLCSSCKNEVAADVAQNGMALNKNPSDNSAQVINEIFAEGLDDEALSRATRSLSKISLDCSIIKEENDYNNQIQQIEQDYLLIEANINGHDDNNEKTNHSPLPFHGDEFSDTGLGEKASIWQDYDNHGIDYMPEYFTEQPVKKHFSDKEVQTEDETSKNQNEQMWDPEFPSGKELEKIDHAVREATITNASKCKRKLTFDDNDYYNFTVIKRSKEVDRPNFNAMVSIKLNREKRLAELSNDLYQLSSYLDDVRKALSVKEPRASVKVPSPPKLIGYDSQFDCLHQNRFAKLPIARVESIDYNKSNGANESLNHKQRAKVSAKKTPNSTLTLKNAKGINNNKNVGVSKKNLYQTTLKEAFNYGKENKTVEKPSHGHKESPQNVHSSTKNSNHMNAEVKSLDSISMYEFNPLRSSTVVKNK